MGIPIKRFICASNSNNVLTDFINTGDYNLQRRQLIKTTSPAIDILVSSNLERYIYHISDRDSGLVRSCYESLKQNGKFSVSSEVWLFSSMKFSVLSVNENVGYLRKGLDGVKKLNTTYKDEWN